MKPSKLVILSIGLLVLSSCSTTREPEESPNLIYSKSHQSDQVRTLLGYTIAEAKMEFALTENPYEISISACHSQAGILIPELNQLRMRLQNDYGQRGTKLFMEKWNHKLLYGGK